MINRSDIDKLKEHVDQRFNSLENKLDDHLERLSKAETSIEWMRGHIKLVFTFAITAAGGVITYFLSRFGD